MLLMVFTGDHLLKEVAEKSRAYYILPQFHNLGGISPKGPMTTLTGQTFYQMHLQKKNKSLRTHTILTRPPIGPYPIASEYYPMVSTVVQSEPDHTPPYEPLNGS